MAAPFGQRAKDAELRLARDSDGMVSCRNCEHRWRPLTAAPLQCPVCRSPRWFRDTYAAGRRAQPKARKVWPMSIH